MKKKTAIWIKIIVLGILTLALIGILIVGILGNTFRNFPIFGSFSSYDNADLYQVGNADISASELSSLSIDWVSGSVKVDVYDGNVIQIREDGASDLSDSDKAHYYYHDGTLDVRYRESGSFFSFFHSLGRKNLEILIPRSLASNLSEISGDVVSADTTINGLSTKNFYLDTVSGNLTFNGSAERIDSDSVSDEQALFVGDVLATGFWAARISEIKPDDTVLIIGAGPTGICTLLCVMLKQPKHIIVCEKSPERARFVREHYPSVEVVAPEDCIATVRQKCERGGADVVLEVAGAEDTFRLAWECARPNAIVTVVALYDKPQMLPLPEMYGKNLTFKTGGVDGCDCAEILSLIEAGKIDTMPLITHRYKLADIAEAYHLFENKLDGVIKVAVEP